MFRLVRLASCGSENGSGPKTEALPNGPKTEAVPKRKRSQNGSAPKMVQKRKRSQNGSGPKTEALPKWSQNGSGPKTEALPNVLGPLPFWDRFRFGTASVLGPFWECFRFGIASVLGPFWNRFRFGTIWERFRFGTASVLGPFSRSVPPRRGWVWWGCGGGVVRAGERVFLSHFWTPDEEAFKPIKIGDVLESGFP